MLPNLIIKNYRNLSDLKIDSLSRVNLITGENNTGKTALLEAISIYASLSSPIWVNWIYSILSDRGEYFRDSSIGEDLTNKNLRFLSGLFTNHKIGYRKDDALKIGSIEEAKSNQIFSLRLLQYTNAIAEEGIILERNGKKVIVEDDKSDSWILYSQKQFPLVIRELDRLRPASISIGDYKFQFVKTTDIGKYENPILWDNIALRPQEESVISALQIINADINRITFVVPDYYSGTNRFAAVTLKSNAERIFLQSMGDGINRILTIILALVNAKDSYLLIDEFENGLHYSVQEKLWEVIFKTAKELNVQVFATTHSEDCVSAFSVVQRRYEEGAGQYIRLQHNKQGNIVGVLYNTEELQIATERDIEPR
jgi:AAA15 family ATPase/GTPase